MKKLTMKKLLVPMMALAMTLNFAACGGSKEAPTTSTSNPTESVSAPAETKEVEFSAEQQALAQDFMSMAEEYDAIADKVNASPELLENEELITAMNDLANEIIKADEYFADPETLTPEVMGALSVAIEVGRTFIAEANAALEEIETKEVEFTAEQQSLAQDFMSMAEEYDAIADKVNASPELLENEELVAAMNDLANEIIKADEYFADPETLTPEVMGALTVAIEVGRTFIAEASAALEEIEN